MTVKPANPVLNSGHSLANGLIAAWLMTEASGGTVADYAGAGGVGACSIQGMVNRADDDPGKVLVFSGGGYLAVPSLAGKFASNEATICTVLKRDAQTPGDGTQTGLHYLSNGYSGEIEIYPWTSGVIEIRSFRHERSGQFSNAFARDNWHTLTVTHKNGADNYRVFQDDGLVHSAAGEATIDVPSSPRLGAWLAYAYFVGRMASVFMWNRALSDAEAASVAADPWVMFRAATAPVISEHYSRMRT